MKYIWNKKVWFNFMIINSNVKIKGMVIKSIMKERGVMLCIIVWISKNVEGM